MTATASVPRLTYRSVEDLSVKAIDTSNAAMATNAA